VPSWLYLSRTTAMPFAAASGIFCNQGQNFFRISARLYKCCMVFG
jgi:hypothetical protein